MPVPDAGEPDPSREGAPQRCVALLRAVNVGGASLPMAQLRALCEELGWAQVSTYIQSGNVVFQAFAPPNSLERQLENAVEQRFRLTRPVLVRTAEQWSAYVTTPFPEEEIAAPNRLMLCLAKRAPAPDAAAILTTRAANGEQIRLVGDALWVFYPGGAGTTKLTPAFFDKAAGSPVTARNFRTICKLHEMLRG